MASANDDDPFLSVQSDVQTTLTQTRTLFSSYLRIRTLASTRPGQKSEELVQARTDLEENLATLSADLQDLLESIAAVEDDPYRFGLDTVEVGRRKGFVRETAGEVEGMRRELADQSGGGGNIAMGAQGLPSPGAFEVDDEYDERRRGRRRNLDPDEDEDADYNAEFEQQQQQVMMEEQDQQLDGVFRSVGVLRNQAEDMGRELEEQGAMLEDVDRLADRVGGKLQVGVKRVGEVIRKNEDGLSSCCIAVLIFVLILLLILVIVI
jgi:member of the syntaxin family of t-SNAREs